MNIFEEVKSQLSITQVVEYFGFKVNRARRFVCPFHNDKNPSASIKNDYFHCFTCGAGGDLITFTAEYLGMSNLDATKKLIEIFNLDIEIYKKENYKERQKKRKEISECSTLREKLAKDKELRRTTKNYKLRNEIRQIRQSREEETEKYIHYVGLVLADMHRFLWQGIQNYNSEHERHIKALQSLSECEYWIDCYDNNPKEFCEKCKGVIERYERELNIINKQD